MGNPQLMTDQTMRSQIGLETLAAPGTLVNPTRQLASLSLIPTPDVESTEDVARGYWAATRQSIGKDASIFDMEAKNFDLDELPLWLASVITGEDGTGTGTPLAPTGAGPNYEWAFFLLPDANNQGQTYSVEWGNAEMGWRTTGVAPVDLSVKGSLTSLALTGKAIGQTLRNYNDGLAPAFTAVQTALAQLAGGGNGVINAKNVCLYLSTTSRDDLNATPGDFTASNPLRLLPAVWDWEWKITGRREGWPAARCDTNGAPAFNVEQFGLDAGYIAHAASEEIMDLNRQLRGLGANDPRRIWVRVEGTGSEIGASGVNYRFFVDFCAFVKPYGKPAPQKGLITANFPLVYAVDPNFGGAGVEGFLEARVVNAQSALLA